MNNTEERDMSWKNEPMRDYLAAECVSGSDIVAILRSPAHMRAKKEHPKKSTDAMTLGTLIHSAVLEPDLFADTLVMAPVNEKTGKPYGRNTKAWHEFAVAHAGQTIVTDAEFRQIADIAKSVRAHGDAFELLQGCSVEMSGYTDVPCGDNGVKALAKIRPDLRNLDGRYIADLKTTHDAGEVGFSRTAANLRYHVKAAWQLDVATKIDGIVYDQFVWIAVETDPPYAVQTFRASDETIGTGRMLYEAALAAYDKCMTDECWPAYGETRRELDLPGWA